MIDTRAGFPEEVNILKEIGDRDVKARDYLKPIATKVESEGFIPKVLSFFFLYENLT